MNNTFDIHRFGKLLAFNGRKYIHNFGLTLAILCGLNLVFWLLTLIFGFTMPTLPRYGVIWLATMLGIIMVPAKAFGDINLSREGVKFAMLPVSNLEKYISYVLFCLLTPVVIVIGSWAIDSLLTLLPFGGFVHYIRHFGFMNVMEDFVREIGELTDEDAEVFEQNFMGIFGSAYSYAIIIGFFFNAGLFMFGNMLFKTHKTAKTLALMIGVSYVVSVIMQIVLIARGGSFMMNTDMSDYTSINQFTNPLFIISNIVNTILTIGLYIGLFFKLKTQKY